MESRRNLAMKLFHKARMGFVIATMFKNIVSEKQMRSQSTRLDTVASGVSKPFTKKSKSFKHHAAHRWKQLRSTARSFAKFAQKKATSVRTKTLHPPGSSHHRQQAFWCHLGHLSAASPSSWLYLDFRPYLKVYRMVRFLLSSRLLVHSWYCSSRSQRHLQRNLEIHFMALLLPSQLSW